MESCLNIQANHNEGFTQRLNDVEFVLAEVTVRQEEERDGRLNERYDFYQFIRFLTAYDEILIFMTSHDIRCLMLSPRLFIFMQCCSLPRYMFFVL
jgi:hypothetical protein